MIISKFTPSKPTNANGCKQFLCHIGWTNFEHYLYYIFHLMANFLHWQNVEDEGTVVWIDWSVKSYILKGFESNKINIDLKEASAPIDRN